MRETMGFKKPIYCQAGGRRGEKRENEVLAATLFGEGDKKKKKGEGRPISDKRL